MVDRRDVPVEVDDDLSEPGLLECRLAKKDVRVRLAEQPGLEDAGHSWLDVRAVVLQEDAALDVDGLEEARAAVHCLRSAEHEVTARAQREEEVAEDALLRLLAEVHERVARYEQVDARDRRILKQVVMAEDDGASEAVAERVVAVQLLEIALAQPVGDVCDLLLRIRGMPRVTQRVVVDVGGVDLDAVAEALVTERLGEDDRDGVRLGARRAARRPDADLSVWAELVDEPRHDLGGDVFPHGGVA